MGEGRVRSHGANGAKLCGEVGVAAVEVDCFVEILLDWVLGMGWMYVPDERSREGGSLEW